MIHESLSIEPFQAGQKLNIDCGPFQGLDAEVTQATGQTPGTCSY